MKPSAHKDEAEFHDAWASDLKPEDVPVRESFEAATSPENRRILRWLGPLQGLKLLDIGCGAGESAVYFSLMGADVTAIDISPGMIALAGRTASLHGVAPNLMVMPADDMTFPDATFDVVYGANVLHHVDKVRCLDHVARVLKPGGRGAFVDPLAHNPVINLYRWMASAVRSEDETPLRMADLEIFRERFRQVEHAEFWLFSLWIFVRFYLIERVHPARERYWKKILTDHARLAPSFLRLARWDERAMMIAPFLGRYCWNIAVMVTR
ncbi:MAG: class I SAM-dependent methyltransferase [Acidobacteria bacterium]|nr:class I SAM-dependent methyltransferase [Acidobacteriota bacterium]